MAKMKFLKKNFVERTCGGHAVLPGSYWMSVDVECLQKLNVCGS